MSIADFFRGMGSINLFPRERDIKYISLPKILSDQEAFKQNLEKVGSDMYHAINIIEKDLNNKNKE